MRIVERLAPALTPLAAEAVNQRWLTDEEAEALVRAAFHEFPDHLGPDGQPDGGGVEADDLLGVIEIQRRGHWKR